MILSKQKCCLLSTGASMESQNVSLYFRQSWQSLAKRNMTCINVGLPPSYVKLLLSSCKTYINRRNYYGDKLCSTHSGFILYFYERDIISHLHISKQYNLINMFNDTSRYIDVISPPITLCLRNITCLTIPLDILT